MKLPTLSTLILALMSTLPATAADDKPAKPEIAIVGGGCFWCTEGAYKIVPGVLKVVSGYSAGQKENPTYEDITSHRTGHAEVIKIDYDPAVVTLEMGSSSGENACAWLTCAPARTPATPASRRRRRRAATWS